MANSNNICTRFINYVAVLILVFLSSQSFASGGSFGGGGAGGSWEDACTFSIPASSPGWNPSKTFISANAACTAYISTYNSNVQSGTIVYKTSNNNSCVVDQYNSNGVKTLTDYSIGITNTCACPVGYEKDANGKCQPKKCPVDETLVNGQCQKKQCPAGQALDTNGNCMPRDDQCPAGQIMVNGRCTQDPNGGDEPPPPAEWPAFCEWASVMCQWHKEWQQWSNDYAANEQKANL